MPTTTAAVTVPPVTAPPGFDTIHITLDGRELVVALAETPEQHRRGLMGVEDLGGLDGMLFSLATTGVRSFWMKNTLVPLDLAFFDEDGVLVGVLSMEPCLDDPCPTYGIEAPSRWALEAPSGSLQNLPPGAVLDTRGF